jgi:hypothetical protein
MQEKTGCAYMLHVNKANAIMLDKAAMLKQACLLQNPMGCMFVCMLQPTVHLRTHTMRWPVSLRVCASVLLGLSYANRALTHKHNQVAGLIACVCKYTAGCCRFMHMQFLYGSQLHNSNRPKCAPTDLS